MYIDVGLCELCAISPKSEHRCRFGAHLHQADLADAADEGRVVSASTKTTASAMSAGRLVLAVSLSMIFRIVARDVGVSPAPRPRIVTGNCRGRLRFVRSVVFCMYARRCQPKHDDRNVPPRRVEVKACRNPQHEGTSYIFRVNNRFAERGGCGRPRSGGEPANGAREIYRARAL